jgi:hypothetical protein
MLPHAARSWNSPFPASQTPWQEIQRATVDQLADGMVLKPAVRYQRVAQRASRATAIERCENSEFDVASRGRWRARRDSNYRRIHFRSSDEGPLRVKLGKAHGEQFLAAVPQKADVPLDLRDRQRHSARKTHGARFDAQARGPALRYRDAPEPTGLTTIKRRPLGCRISSPPSRHSTRPRTEPDARPRGIAR